jgi:hypothetical protein
MVIPNIGSRNGIDPVLVAMKAMEAGFEKSPVPSTVILGSRARMALGTPIKVAIAKAAAKSFPAIDQGFLGGGRVAGGGGGDGSGDVGGCFREAGCCFAGFLGLCLLRLRMAGMWW